MIKTAPVYAGGFFCVFLLSLCLIGTGIVAVFVRNLPAKGDGTDLEAIAQEMPPFSMIFYGSLLMFAGIILILSNLVRLCILCPGACCKRVSTIANKELICMLYGLTFESAPGGDDGQQQFSDMELRRGSSPPILHKPQVPREPLRFYVDESTQTSREKEFDYQASTYGCLGSGPKMSCSSYATTGTSNAVNSQTPAGKVKKHDPLPIKPLKDWKMEKYEKLKDELKRVTERLEAREKRETEGNYSTSIIAAREIKNIATQIPAGKTAWIPKDVAASHRSDSAVGTSTGASSSVSCSNNNEAGMKDALKSQLNKISETPPTRFHSISGSSPSFVGSTQDTRESPVSVHTTSDSSYKYWRGGFPTRYLSDPSFDAGGSIPRDSLESLETAGYAVVGVLSDMSLQTVHEGRDFAGSYPGGPADFSQELGRQTSNVEFESAQEHYCQETCRHSDNESTATVDT